MNEKVVNIIERGPKKYINVNVPLKPHIEFPYSIDEDNLIVQILWRTKGENLDYPIKENIIPKILYEKGKPIENSESKIEELSSEGYFNENGKLIFVYENQNNIYRFNIIDDRNKRIGF